MLNEGSQIKEGIRRKLPKIAKAAVKTTIVCAIYFILVQLIEPVSAIIPGLQQMIQTFTIVYIALMIIGDLTSGTIVQHVFDAAKALFVIVYLAFLLNAGVFEYTFGNVNLIVDLRLFLIIPMLFGLLGLAKSVLQAIDYVTERTETYSSSTAHLSFD